MSKVTTVFTIQPGPAVRTATKIQVDGTCGNPVSLVTLNVRPTPDRTSGTIDNDPTTRIDAKTTEFQDLNNCVLALETGGGVVDVHIECSKGRDNVLNVKRIWCRHSPATIESTLRQLRDNSAAMLRELRWLRKIVTEALEQRIETRPSERSSGGALPPAQRPDRGGQLPRKQLRPVQKRKQHR